MLFRLKLLKFFHELILIIQRFIILKFDYFTQIRRQIEKKFKKIATNELKVGSVEEFQGDEKLVIIVSTVRATAEHLAHDEFYKLGFLKNPKVSL